MNMKCVAKIVDSVEYLEEKKIQLCIEKKKF